MMRPWRCMNCSHAGKPLDFFAEVGKCPGCELNSDDNPRVVGSLTIIHFDPPAESKTAAFEKRIGGVLVKCGEGGHLSSQKRRACSDSPGLNIPIPPERVDSHDIILHAASGEVGSVTCYGCRKSPEFKKGKAELADHGVKIMAFVGEEPTEPVKTQEPSPAIANDVSERGDL